MGRRSSASVALLRTRQYVQRVEVRNSEERVDKRRERGECTEEQDSIDAFGGGSLTSPNGFLEFGNPVEGGGPRLRVIRKLDRHRSTQLVDLVEGSAACVSVAKSHPRCRCRSAMLDMLLFQ
jgi:hypothetical protein